MKDVNLSRPAIIADITRYPTENPITVTDEDAARLKAADCLEDEPKKSAAAGKEA